MARIRKFHLPGCSGGDCECLWELDYRPLGMYGPRRRVRFPTKKAAERFQAETALQAARGEYVEPAKVPTFAEVAEDWFQSKTDRRPSHVSDLRTRLDKHILPVFAIHKVDRISVATVEKFRNDLRDREYAHRTINAILRIMGAIIRLAIKRGQCTRNPLDSVERAAPAAREIKEDHVGASDSSNDTVDPDSVLSPTEIQQLLAAARPGFERVLFASAYLTGAREGELLALRWSDLELPKEGSGKMAIRRSLSWARLKGEETRPRYFPPKTKAGRRTISIAPLLVADLKRWRLQCPKSEQDLVFPTADGKPVCRDALLRVNFYPALSRARLRRVTFHTLRHSHASAMIAKAPITEVQHRLGHASPAITLQIYSHFIPQTESAAADRLADEVLNSPSPKAQKEIASAIAS
ncbi:MAG: tyrosine-type recombinase/integrase [Steroidobacteraceae bacterium]